ncbi:MAG TPA: anthrone oxygenase family protein [Actinoplanes sp.]|nr:anthrone oxygenase family protein [Actinoplanes sp.]
MTNGVIVKIVRLLSLLTGGVFAGFLVTVLVVESTLRSFDATGYIEVRQVELAHLDDLASATLIPTLIGAAILVAFAARTRGRAFWLTLTPVLLLVVVLATSLLVNVPINHDQLTWNVQAPPADWASVRDRWQIAHAVRTVGALLAFGCLSVAAIGAPATARRHMRSEDRQVPTSLRV